MIKFIKILILSTIISCGVESESKRTYTRSNEIVALKNQVLALQGTINQINNFVISDFTACNNNLPPFERKVCQIAQTATAEQKIVFIGQLQQIAKLFQTEIYGQDCLDDTSAGCPVVGSILERLNNSNSQAAQFSNDIAQLQLEVLQLQADLATINARLNNFDGSGSSIESIISGLTNALSTLEDRVSDIEQILNTGDIYKTHFLCGDNADSGPIFEPILMSGNSQKLFAYINTTSENGMGVIAEAGVTGHLTYLTDANSKQCRFRIYDTGTLLHVCWKNDQRMAPANQIDNVCDLANNFSTPASTCTCVGG
jgi:hypothetical protein